MTLTWPIGGASGMIVVGRMLLVIGLTYLVHRKVTIKALRFRILTRGLTRRCPRCGEWGIFEGYFRMAKRCPRCDLDLEREDGYYVGAMTVNIGVAELVTALALVVAIIFTWPSLPVVPLVAGGVALNIAFPILFYPFSKTIWLAFDLSFFHPLSPSEMR